MSQFIHKFESSKFNEWLLIHFQDPDTSTLISTKLFDYNKCKPTILHKWSKVTISNQIITNGIKCLVQIDNSIDLSLFDKLNFCFNTYSGVKIEIYLIIEEEKHIVKKLQASGIREEVLYDIPAELKQRCVSGISIYCESNYNHSPVSLDLNWVSGIISDKNTCLAYSDRNIEALFSNKINFDKHSFIKNMMSDYDSFNNVREKISYDPYISLFNEMKIAAERYLSIDVSSQQQAYLPGYDKRFVRIFERDRQTIHSAALTLGFVGLVLKEEKYVNKCWEFIIALIDSASWFSSAEDKMKTSAWNARGFLPESTTFTLSILLDWFGKNMSNSFYKAAQKAIWIRGISECHSDLLRFPYMKKMNQGPTFMRSLILGSLALENTWETAGMADQYYSDFDKVIFDEKILDKFEEGPVYLTQMLQTFLFSIVCYSNSRKLNLTKELEKYIKPCLDYLETLHGPNDGSFYPLSDSRKTHGSGDFFAIAAKLYPENKWLNNAAYEVIKSGEAYFSSGTQKNTGGILSLLYGPKTMNKIKTGEKKSYWSKYEPLNIFRYNHHSNLNKFDLMIIGASKREFHSHKDIGSFIFSLDEQPVFIDPGIIEYDDILAYTFKEAYLHNVLLVKVDESFQEPQELSFQKNALSGSSNKTLTLELDGIYDSVDTYSRIFKNVQSNSFEIIDKVLLKSKAELTFNLLTPQPVKQMDNFIVIDLGDSSVQVEAPWIKKSEVKQISISTYKDDVNIIQLTSHAKTNFEISTKFKF
tara:strand:+ start:65 stop:2335 length:2271 start_codon:yes stop_codon:yes gene_type:complete